MSTFSFNVRSRIPDRRTVVKVELQPGFTPLLNQVLITGLEEAFTSVDKRVHPFIPLVRDTEPHIVAVGRQNGKLSVFLPEGPAVDPHVDWIIRVPGLKYSAELQAVNEGLSKKVQRWLALIIISNQSLIDIPLDLILEVGGNAQRMEELLDVVPETEHLRVVVGNRLFDILLWRVVVLQVDGVLLPENFDLQLHLSAFY